MVEGEMRFVNLLITMCCEVLDTRDFMRLLGGDLMTFGNYRSQMRRYIIEHILDDNSRPSPEDLENVSRRFQISESIINRLFQMNPSLRRYVDVEDVGRVDVVATAMNIDRIHLQQLLSLLINTSDTIVFPEKLCEIFSGYFRRFVTIANLSSNSPTGYSDILMQLTRNEGHDGDAQDQLYENFLENSEPGNDFVVLRNLMESSLPRLEAYLSEEGPYNPVDIAGELITIDPASITTEEPTWDNNSVGTMISNTSRNLHVQEGRQSASNSVKNIRSYPRDKSLPNVSDVTSDLTGFPDPWIHVIRQDILTQRNFHSSLPLSDAYRSGDPFIQRQGGYATVSSHEPSTSSNSGSLNGESSSNFGKCSSSSSDDKQKMVAGTAENNSTNNSKPVEVVDASAMEVDSSDLVEEQMKVSKAT
uniref:CCR4-NOT transcription complex subunit 11 n=1 Tax=Syphacia muris TaxID=451379 RepID=A0A0N5AV48_9BILA